MLTLAVAAPASASPWLSASKTGGIAGVSTSLVVSSNGHARTQSRGSKPHRFRVSSKKLRLLKRHVAKADFAHLRSSYGPRNCADAFVYRLTHAKYDVTIIQCGTNLPSRLQALLDDVTALLPAY